MFLLKLLFSFLLVNASTQTNHINFKPIIGKPNIYQNEIIIPKIKLNQHYIIGNRQMNKFKHVQLAPYSNLPNEKGAHLIFMAHSGNSNISYFKDIDKLNINDNIYITYNHTKYNYLVYKKIVISPTNIEALYYKPNNIILLTCYRHNYRTLVYGKLKTVIK